MKKTLLFLLILSILSTNSIAQNINNTNLGPVYFSTFEANPDFSRIVYLSDRETANIVELYSVPFLGGEPTKLNGTLVTGGDVRSFKISPDGNTVVYLATQEFASRAELYSVPITGGTVVKLSDSSTPVNDRFKISADSSTVVFLTQELYSVSITGGERIALTELPVGVNVFTYEISPDNTTVVYIASETGPIFEVDIYSVPIQGGASVQLNPDAVGEGRVYAIFKISPGSDRVIFHGDIETEGIVELYSVPIQGGEAIRLGETFGNDGQGAVGFSVTPDNSRVVFLSDEETGVEFVDDLFSIPIDGGIATKLNLTTTNPMGVLRFEIASDSNTVFYNADQDTPMVSELYSASIQGGSNIKLNTTMSDGERVQYFKVSPDGNTIIYSVGFISPHGFTTELSSTSSALASGIKIHTDVTTGSGVQSSNFTISSDSRSVVFQLKIDEETPTEVYRYSMFEDQLLKLNPTPVTGGNTFLPKTNFDATQVIYVGDQETDGVSELFSTFVSPCDAITTYTIDGGWDNGIPDNTKIAVITEDYDITTLGDIIACELIIDTNATLTIPDSHYISVLHNIIVNGALHIESEGSVVQIKDDSQTINNGAITVRKITPTISARNFLAVSSPMSASKRNEVYENSRLVYGIISENFIPYDIDFELFPEFEFSENFLDDDGDYLDLYTENRPLPLPGNGLLVFPSQSEEDPDASYIFDFTQGTLHSGDISVAINYNGPETINNYNLLGNPYPSAMDVTALITENDAINEVYYWDHLTDPSADLPGFGSSGNFSMNDISIRNLMMGVGALNGSTPPGPFMASGQGFGIKADQSEMVNNTPIVFKNNLRVTGNNDDFRSQETTNTMDRIWLNLSATTFGDVKSQTGIGFVPDATQEFDKGFDSHRLGTFISLFTTLETGEYLAIQGREAFDSTLEIMVGFSTSLEENIEYVISIDHIEGIHLEEVPVFLIDNFLGTMINLKENEYAFLANKIIQPERFTLIFRNPDVLSIAEDRFRESDIKIYPNPVSDVLTIEVAPSISYIKTVVYSLLGEKLMETNGITIDFSNLSKGVYFMEVFTDSGSSTKKIIKK